MKLTQDLVELKQIHPLSTAQQSQIKGGTCEEKRAKVKNVKKVNH